MKINLIKEKAKINKSVITKVKRHISSEIYRKIIAKEKLYKNDDENITIIRVKREQKDRRQIKTSKTLANTFRKVYQTQTVEI